MPKQKTARRTVGDRRYGLHALATTTMIDWEARSLRKV
jgi:hypothetical protein